jgi:hypothetical protein
MAEQSASDEIKRLALDGEFDRIEERHGSKRLGKALDYAYQKLQQLTEKKDAEEDITPLKYATPFILHLSSPLTRHSIKGSSDLKHLGQLFCGTGNAKKVRISQVYDLALSNRFLFE